MQENQFDAALSFYIGRAESLGIKVRHEINLPDKFSTDESDFALLVSNLLENAINACSKQNFGEKNYPQASREGHGLGMASIKLFSEKYGAYTDFSIEGGLFKLTMYRRIAN